jgi:hypothetical protein
VPCRSCRSAALRYLDAEKFCGQKFAASIFLALVAGSKEISFHPQNAWRHESLCPEPGIGNFSICRITYAERTITLL